LTQGTRTQPFSAECFRTGIGGNHKNGETRAKKNFRIVATSNENDSGLRERRIAGVKEHSAESSNVPLLLEKPVEGVPG